PWRSGNDAVEVGGITLRLHQRLPSAVRAAFKIRLPWHSSVKSLDNLLRGYRGGVHGPVAKINLPLGIVQRPATIASPALVPSVGSCRRIAAHEGGAGGQN